MGNLAGIASLVSALAAMGAVLMSAYNAKKIQQVHISINSRMDQLLAERGRASLSEGLELGRNEPRPRLEEAPTKVDIGKLPPSQKS